MSFTVPDRLSSGQRYATELAIFRFEEVCVLVQEGMKDFLRTAALQVRPGVETTFRWLQRRGIRIGLVTDYGRSDLLMLLDRLGWGTGEGIKIDLVVVEQRKQLNPVKLAVEAAGLKSSQRAMVIVDTPRLLRCARDIGVEDVFGVTNGRCAYQELAAEPCRALLDNVMQLPAQLLPQQLSGSTLPVKTNLGGPPEMRHAG